MQRLSIARSFRLALVGLTLALAIIAGLGIAALYSTRQSYEDTLSSTAALSVAAANLTAASITEDEVLRDTRGRAGAAARQAAATYDSAANTARSLAAGDPVSRQLLVQQIADEQRARQLAATGQLAGATST